jgi:hypothetical protein
MDIYIWIIIGTPLLLLFMRINWDLFFGYLAYRRGLEKNVASLATSVGHPQFISNA